MWEVIGDRTMVWRFVALPAGTRSAYVWHWLCENERGEVELRSARGYAFYYECLEDARRHGYDGLPPDTDITKSDQPLVGTAAKSSFVTDPGGGPKKEQAG